MKKIILIPAVLLTALLLTTCGRTGPSGPPDLAPPLVASVTPSPTEPVPINIAALAVRFNEDLDAATITSQTVWLEQGGALVDGSVSYQDRAIVFTPAAILNPSSIYTLVITEKVRDLAGNPLAQRYIGVFFTGANSDLTPPTVSSVTPAPGSIDVGVNSSVTVIFSEAMLLSSIPTAFFVKTGPDSVEGTIEANGNTSIFTPSGDLLYNTTYTVIISKDVTDVAGNPLGSDYSWSFTTGGEPSVPTYTIDVIAGTHGRIEPGSVTVTEGASQSFTIVPDDGYAILSVVVDQSPVNAVSSYTFSNVTGNHTIRATFIPTSHTIVASAGTGGSITPSGAVTVQTGGEQTFTITPGPGYAISNVMVDGSPVGIVMSYTFTDVTGDHSISASFAPVPAPPHTITATAVGNGTITPFNEVSVSDGGDLMFTIVPDEEYQIADVLVDDTSVGLVSEYTFTSVTADHTITAVFTQILQ